MSKFDLQRHKLAARFAKPRTMMLGAAGVRDGVGTAARDVPFTDWCAANPGGACALVVGARLLHDFAFEPGLPLADAAAREAYARQQFVHYYGASAQRWAVASWQVGAPGGGSGQGSQGGASALHGVDLALLRAAAEEHGVSLRRVEPFWAPLLRALKRREPDWFAAERAALAWVEGSLLSWITLGAGRVTGLRALRLAEPTHAALQALLAELRDAEPTATPAQGGAGTAAPPRVVLGGFGLDAVATPALPGVTLLGRLDTAAPDAELFADAAADAMLPAPDFLGTRTPRSPLAWPLAATGLIVLATAGWSLAGSHRQRVDADARVADLERLTHAAHDAAQHGGANKPQLAVSTSITAASRAAEDSKLRELRAVQALLDTPWGPLLATVEQAGLFGAAKPDARGLGGGGSGGRVDWLNLDYNAARANLRLAGLASDKAAALQLVDRLGAAPGFDEVLMNRIEEGPPGQPGQRFEIGARVDTPLLASAAAEAQLAAASASAATAASAPPAATARSARPAAAATHMAAASAPGARR